MTSARMAFLLLVVAGSVSGVASVVLLWLMLARPLLFLQFAAGF